ncbi:hypothetical protein [Cupriavidus sp. UYPR2.512]|uniref:hypothetical protein n=1 Tax=Cupriavidus sp. UYPR2.512 TaxID=1080187 RepID=UPI00037A4EDC|nr:hypothetical protein [Cupriavidus sp. UYPR2.512]UIF90913.1 hypothetical protein KAF44_32525 [Cupriavidus necator]
MRTDPSYCDHQYECVHFDGIYRCMHCGDRTRYPHNGRAPFTEDMCAAIDAALRAKEGESNADA